MTPGECEPRIVPANPGFLEAPVRTHALHFKRRSETSGGRTEQDAQTKSESDAVFWSRAHINVQ
jgi:hypothetical protein